MVEELIKEMRRSDSSRLLLDHYSWTELMKSSHYDGGGMYKGLLVFVYRGNSNERLVEVK